jgi:hypothetical protein
VFFLARYLKMQKHTANPQLTRKTHGLAADGQFCDHLIRWVIYVVAMLDGTLCIGSLSNESIMVVRVTMEPNFGGPSKANVIQL